MSFQEKLRLRLPAYLIFSFLGFLGLMSLWLPRWVNQNIEDAQALTYSATSTISTRVPADSKNRLIALGDTFYLLYTSSTWAGTTSTCGPEGTCRVYFTSSSNGTSWSSPVTVSAVTIKADDGNNESAPLGGFAYNSRRGYFTTLYKGYSDNKIYLATSTNGVSWRGGVVVTTHDGGGPTTPSARTYVAFGTSTDVAAIAYRNGGQIFIATTSDPALNLSTWASSSIASVAHTYNGDGYVADVIGVSVEGTSKLHVVYGTATSTPASTTFIHALSTDLGKTWTTSTITSIGFGNENLISSDLQAAATAVTTEGKLGLVFRHFTAADMSGYPELVLASSTYIFAQQNSAGTWVTSSFATQQNSLAFNHPLFHTRYPGVTFYNNNQPITSFFATSSNLYSGINTSTFITELVSTDVVAQGAGMSVALNTSSRQLGFVYVSGFQMRFVTSSLRDPLWNALPTSTAITPTFATSGTGYVTVTTTISDVETDEATLFVDYSVNGGTTWASTTLASASATTGSVTASTGRVSGISTASANPLTFVWDSKTDGVTATTSAMIRIGGYDSYGGTILYRQSATFTVDNVPLSAPAAQSVSVGTSTASFTWSDVSGANSYTVSSTAGAASTTLSTVTTTSYIDLAPNTLYSFQVRNTDVYGNTSTFSSASSTYTNPVAPGTPSASAGGTTSMTVTWSANSNGSGTVYEVYNVTTDAVAATTTEVSYSVTGLTANTSYQFKIRAQYLADSASYSAYSATSTAASTSAASSSGSSSSGGSAASAPAAPAVPASVPPVPPTPRTDTIPVGQPTPVSIGGASHTVTVQQASASQATMEIRSNPIVVTVSKDSAKLVDTDDDSINDVKVEYLGLVSGKPQFKFTNLTDINQVKSAFTINAGAYETASQQVRLDFNVPDAVQMAVSADPNFAGAEFRTYQKNLTWTLPSGQGTKTLYVRFRTANGGTASVQDSITMTIAGVESVIAPPVVTVPTETPVVPPASTYQFTKTLSAGARGADVTELQKRLKAMGYMTDEPTGFYGVKTTAAVKKFQAANKISQVGSVGPATRAALNKGTVATTPAPTTGAPAAPVYSGNLTFTKNLYAGSRGTDVTELQKRLKAMGYMTDEPTGFYGVKTTAAVKKFQAAKGINPQTGGVGPATRAALNQ